MERNRGGTEEAGTTVGDRSTTTAARRGLARHRLRRIAVGEAVATAVIVAVAAFSVAPRLAPEDRLAFALSLVPLAAVLVQGTAYWWLAGGWAVGGRMGPGVAAAYRAFRVVDPVLWAGCLIAVVLLAPQAGAAVLCGIGLVFGLVEYVNYYVARLSYPWTEWLGSVARWSTPRLVRDLRAARRTDGRHA